MAAGGRPKPPTRQRSVEELLNDVHKAARFIDEGLTRLDDDGDLLGVDRIAGPLRLLACRGRGNELISRVCERLGRSLPLVAHGKPPQDHPTISFAIGALPEADDVAPTTPLGRFMGLHCLTAQDASGQYAFTWNELITTTANKMLLVHSDDDLPAIMDEIVCYEVLGKQVVPFMVRAAGVVVLRAAGEVLAGAGAGAGAGTQFGNHSASLRGAGLLHGVELRERSRWKAGPGSAVAPAR